MERLDPETLGRTDDEVVRAGGRFGYGHWLSPIVNANNMESSSPEAAAPSESGEAAAPRRGRGRPRVNKARDESAIEKRRAQVREAQRTYQKRKDSAAANERRRCDDVLQVLSDLSTDVEALLRAASNAGTMSQEGEVADRIRQLWSSYDTAVNSPHVRPELRLLQVKNDRRRAEHQSNENFRIGVAPTTQREGPQETPRDDEATEADPDTDVHLVRIDDTTIIQPFKDIQSAYPLMGGRSIFQVIKERQAVFNSQNPASS